LDAAAAAAFAAAPTSQPAAAAAAPPALRVLRVLRVLRAEGEGAEFSSSPAALLVLAGPWPSSPGLSSRRIS
jgi:hypothetical protein